MCNFAPEMKTLDYIKHKDKRAIWLRAFRIWQRRPYQVAPLSDHSHQCSSCATSFQGNFCPRCGQSAQIGRFSFKKSFLLFLDVWGLGNRGMFRTIRDLMFRPGYMIRDYLRGMQSAYFPPFKMFFLLAALALVVQHGFNFSLSAKEDAEESSVTVVTDEHQTSNFNLQTSNLTDSTSGAEASTPSDTSSLQKGQAQLVKIAQILNTLNEKNHALFSLVSLIMFFLPLFFFLRKSPTIPDLRFSEFIVALVYTSNAYSIFSIAGDFLHCVLFEFIAFLIMFVTLKEFSGYSIPRLIAYLLLTVLISFAVIVFAIALIFLIPYFRGQGG